MRDPYIYENGVLKNKLEINNYQDLKEAEADIGFVKLLNVESVKHEKCDINLVKAIHKHIFEDIFDWAGEFRTIPIQKIELIIPGASLEYAEPEEINDRLEIVINEMNSYEWKNKSIDEITKSFTNYLARLWRVHPFRDGNTRTTLAFANIFSKEHGFELDMTTMLDQLYRLQEKSTGKVIRWSVRDKFVLAALDEKDKPEPKALQQVIKQAINKAKKKNAKSRDEEEGR